MDVVIRYLDEADPEVAKRARARYACFEAIEKDPQAYGYAAAYGDSEPCEGKAGEELLELQRRAGGLAFRDGRDGEDEFFDAEQDARLAKDAEPHCRQVCHG